jgi:hypothetical protein
MEPVNNKEKRYLISVKDQQPSNIKIGEKNSQEKTGTFLKSSH